MLIAKWKDRNVKNQNPPQNPNLNIQNISAKPREPIIVIITRGGVATRADQEALKEKLRPQVRPVTHKKVSFDVQKQKELFLDV